MFEQTITVWSRAADETYTRNTIPDVYWEDNRGAQLRKTGTSDANGIVCIIPLKSTPDGFSIKPHDFIMQGESALEPKTAKELLAAGAVLVSAADYLPFGGLAHWEVTGK